MREKLDNAEGKIEASGQSEQPWRVDAAIGFVADRRKQRNRVRKIVRDARRRRTTLDSQIIEPLFRQGRKITRLEH